MFIYPIDRQYAFYFLLLVHAGLTLYVFYFLAVLVFVAPSRLSLVVVSGGCSSLWCTVFSLEWLSLLWSTCSWCSGFCGCGLWPRLLSRAGPWAHGLQWLWCMDGLSCSAPCGSCQTKDCAHVSCIGRWIPYHWTTRKPPALTFYLGVYFG